MSVIAVESLATRRWWTGVGRELPAIRPDPRDGNARKPEREGV